MLDGSTIGIPTIKPVVSAQVIVVVPFVVQFVSTLPNAVRLMLGLILVAVVAVVSV